MTPVEFLESKIVEKFKNKKRFSEASGIPYMTITNILNRGLDHAEMSTVLRICRALDTPLKDLMFLSEQEEVRSSQNHIIAKPRNSEKALFILSDEDMNVVLRFLNSMNKD